MKTEISYHNIQKRSHAELEGLIDELSQTHLERHMTKFPADATELHVHVEKSEHHSRYRIKLRLGIPKENLESADESDEIIPALRKSFAELERQLEEHLTRIRQEGRGAP